MKKTIIKSLVIIGGAIIAVNGVGYFLTKDSDDFCLSIEPDDTVEIVQSKAKSYDYKVHEREVSDNKMKLVIPTQDSPFFRFACVVNFQNGKQVSKEVVAAD